jgi:hypothetical protein
MRQKPLFSPSNRGHYGTPGGRNRHDRYGNQPSIRQLGFFYKGPMMFCITCGRAANNKICCGHETLSIGFHGRAPRTTASRKQWKRFCQEFGISFESLKFV